MFNWFKFNPKEDDTTTFEVSNDDGEQIVFTVPTKGSNRIRQALRQAEISKDNDHKNYRVICSKDGVDRDQEQLRWWAQRDVDPQEDIEWQGDQEGGPAGDDLEDDREGVDPLVDDEESEQTALRFWPRW